MKKLINAYRGIIIKMLRKRVAENGYFGARMERMSMESARFVEFARTAKNSRLREAFVEHAEMYNRRYYYYFKKSIQQMNYGKAFKKIREENKASRSTVSKSIGCTPSSLSKIENGKVIPKPATIDRLCKTYSIPPARFYTMAFEPSDFSVS